MNYMRERKQNSFKFDLELGVILTLWASANWFKKSKFLSQDRSRNDNVRMDK